MKFHSEVRLSGKTATGIPVPPEVIEGLGAGKRPAVSITINGYTYRTTLGWVDGEPMIPLSAENRTGSKVNAGDTVDVEIELDTLPREVTVPPDLAQALNQEPEAKRFFDGLTYSNKQRIVLQVEGAKTEETRNRRIEKAVSMLREGRT